jgi:hypothetical protein
LLTRPPIKQTELGLDKEGGDLENLQRMIKKLSNKIIDMKRSVGEGNQNKIPYKTLFNRNPPFKSIEPPPTNLNIQKGTTLNGCTLFLYVPPRESFRNGQPSMGAHSEFNG